MHAYVLYAQILEALNELAFISYWDLNKPIYDESMVHEIEDLVDSSPIAYQIEWIPSPCYDFGMAVRLTNLEE